VFVVFGRNHNQRDAMYEYLRSLGLEPIDWIRAKELTKVPMPTIFQVVDAGMRNAQACIVLITGDDVGYLRPELQTPEDKDYEREPTPQARANVIFEAGMALGRYQHRTIFTQFGNVRPFSDVGGFALIEYKQDGNFREELRSALKTAGCPVGESDDWRGAGRFSELAVAGGR
jgi:predicted nucleotide-binding protein